MILRFDIALQDITTEVAVRRSTIPQILIVLWRKVVTGPCTKEVEFSEYWIGYESTGTLLLLDFWRLPGVHQGSFLSIVTHSEVVA